MHYSGKKKKNMLGEVWGQLRLLFSRLLMNGCVDTDPCTVSLYCGSMLCGLILAVTASKGAYQNRVVGHWTKRASYSHSFKLFTEIIDHWLYTNSTASTSTLPSTQPTLLVVCYINLITHQLTEKRHFLAITRKQLCTSQTAGIENEAIIALAKILVSYVLSSSASVHYVPPHTLTPTQSCLSIYGTASAEFTTFPVKRGAFEVVVHFSSDQLADQLADILNDEDTEVV